LGEIKDARSTQPLKDALKDKDSYIRKEAIKALEKITGEDFWVVPLK
jgi:HEAT repeat protein